MSGLAMLRSLRGSLFVAVRRVVYVYRGAIYSETGPLELTFEPDTSVLLDARGDGETLFVSVGAWTDPFAEPMSEENRLFVEKSGKWVVSDVGVGEPLSGAIGLRLDQIDEVRDDSGKLYGLVLRLDHAVIRVTVDADELDVDIALGR